MNRDLTGWDEETGEVLVLFLHDMLTTLEFIAVGRDRFYQASLRAFFWDGPDPDNRQEVVDYIDFLTGVIFGPAVPTGATGWYTRKWEYTEDLDAI